MILFMAALFVLYIAFFIGLRVGQSVQDEIVPARRYLGFGADVLLLLIVSLALYGYGLPLVALAAAAALIACRAFLPFTYAYASLSGAVLGAAVLLPVQFQVLVAVLALVMNYLLGATGRTAQKLVLLSIWQPVIAVIIAIVLLTG